jgi:hypothetical protein
LGVAFAIPAICCQVLQFTSGSGLQPTHTDAFFFNCKFFLRFRSKQEDMAETIRHGGAAATSSEEDAWMLAQWQNDTFRDRDMQSNAARSMTNTSTLSTHSDFGTFTSVQMKMHPAGLQGLQTSNLRGSPAHMSGAIPPNKEHARAIPGLLSSHPSAPIVVAPSRSACLPVCMMTRTVFPPPLNI